MKIVKILSLSLLIGLSILSISSSDLRYSIKDPQENLDDAIKMNDTKLVQAALNSGASVNKSYKGLYPLIRAASFGNLNMVEYLLNKSAVIDIEDTQKMTPLHYAAALKNDSILKLLLKEGAESSLMDKDGENPLHIAAKYGRLDAVKDLRNANASLMLQKNDKGDTPLDLAKKLNRKEVVEYLEK